MAFKASAPREQLEQIAREEGCVVDVKASYVKVTKGKSKNCLFVAKTKGVSRVDIGGFDVPDLDIVRNLGGESHGCVHQQMRSDIETEAYLAGYRKICRGLDQFPSHPKKERNRPHGFRGSKKKAPADSIVIVKTEETAQDTVDRLVAKLALIRKTANEMGVPVSPKTERELLEQIERARKQIGG